MLALQRLSKSPFPSILWMKNHFDVHVLQNMHICSSTDIENSVVCWSTVFRDCSSAWSGKISDLEKHPKAEESIFASTS